MMETCWNDSPEERPAFEFIRSSIRCIMKYFIHLFTVERLMMHYIFRGYSENLMDDLLRRMEQYANNLEALVSEKTEQLSQEKRRSEELLYQVRS